MSGKQDLQPRRNTGSPSARFEVYEDPAGQTRFRFLGAGGEVIFSSEGYRSRSSAMQAIESIKKQTATAVTPPKRSTLVEHILSGPQWPDEMYDEVARRDDQSGRPPVDL